MALLVGVLARPVSVLAQTGGAPARHEAGEPEIDAYFDAPYGAAYEDTMTWRINQQIHRFFRQYTDRITGQRGRYWDRDLASWEAYRTSVAENRKRLRTLTGVVDERRAPDMEFLRSRPIDSLNPLERPPNRLAIAETERYRVYQVRWPVLEGITGTGLLLRPKDSIRAHVLAYPDADQRPAQIAGLEARIGPGTSYARHLAASGIEVVVPLLISRSNRHSGRKVIPYNFWRDESEEQFYRHSDQTHREWIWRQAYPNGRHPVGFEIQKGLAVIDWFERRTATDRPIGVAGYGEGGLMALYAAALDVRIDAAFVSGYFGPREALWTEPVSRHVWSLLKRFGDAEIASLLGRRDLIIEYSQVPEFQSPAPFAPEVRAMQGFPEFVSRDAIPGRLGTPSFDSVRSEVDRLRGFFKGGALEPSVAFVHGKDGEPVGPGSREALYSFVSALSAGTLVQPHSSGETWRHPAPADRMRAQIEEISRHLMREVHQADFTRYRYIDGDLSSPAAWKRSMDPYRDSLYEQVIGRLEAEEPEPKVRRRKIYDRDGWIGHEIVMNVLPGVHGWGILAVPKGLDEGEKRPVVVVQHGHLGAPSSALKVDSYNRIMSRLARRGFIVFAPFSSYEWKVRMAYPLGASVFSILIPQYEQMVDWLSGLEHVDPERIGYYGKSWGGRAGLFIPPFIEEFKAIVSSAYFNQWTRKLVTPRYATSYMWHGTAGTLNVFQFNQGRTFGHAELALLSAPRPYMVETGYFDAVQPEEWTAYEFAKVKRIYELLGIGSRAILGTHVGGHEVHAETVFPFLHEHLERPVPATD